MPTNKNSSGVTRYVYVYCVVLSFLINLHILILIHLFCFDYVRYGPWELLLKRGSAAFPVGENLTIDSEIYGSFQESWESYADKCTIESIGLSDGDKLMFEYALVGKDGNL